MRSQPLPNLLATPYVFHRLEPVTERLATEQLPAVLDADLKTWYLNRTATILAPHLLEFYRRQVKKPSPRRVSTPSHLPPGRFCK